MSFANPKFKRRLNETSFSLYPSTLFYNTPLIILSLYLGKYMNTLNTVINLSANLQIFLYKKHKMKKTLANFDLKYLKIQSFRLFLGS